MVELVVAIPDASSIDLLKHYHHYHGLCLHLEESYLCGKNLTNTFDVVAVSDGIVNTLDIFWLVSVSPFHGCVL